MRFSLLFRVASGLLESPLNPENNVSNNAKQYPVLDLCVFDFIQLPWNVDEAERGMIGEKKQKENICN